MQFGWPHLSKPRRGSQLDRTNPLTQGLVGFWPLNEGAGAPFNVATGTTGTTNTIPWEALPVGRGYGLHNRNASPGVTTIPVAVGSSLDLAGAAGISFGAWVYSISKTVYQAVIMRANGATSTNRQYGFQISGAGTNFIFVDIGCGILSTDVSVSANPWTLAAWNYILITWDGATASVYINGELGGSHAAVGSIPAIGSAPLYLGYNGGGSNAGLAGYIDSVSIYNRCLSAGEAAILGGSTSGVWQMFAPGPLRSWAFLQGLGALFGSSSGGVVAGGNSAPSVAFAPVASGGPVAGGAATPATTFIATASGGAIVGGLATPAATFVAVASGGPVAGGIAQPASTGTFTAIASGGPVVGGVAAPMATFAATARGGLVAGGSAQPILLGGPAAATFRQALHAELLATSAVTAIVGTSVYPGSLPRTHDLEANGPALTYAVFKFSTGFRRHPGHNLSGSDGTIMARVRFDAWSYQYSESDAITAALYQALEGLINATWGTTAIVSCIHANEVDIATPDPVRRNLIYQITSEYDIRYRVTIPARS